MARLRLMLLENLCNIQPRPSAITDIEIQAPAVGAERRVGMTDTPRAGAFRIIELAYHHGFARADVADHHGPAPFGAVEWFTFRRGIGCKELAIWECESSFECRMSEMCRITATVV